MTRFTLLSIVVLCLSNLCHAQIKPVAIEKIDSLMNEQAKPLIILLSTEWCKYCLMQKKQLQENKDFIRRADDFYYTEFNAESEGEVTFHNQNYNFKASGSLIGIHELAVALNGSELISFPTWVLLNKDYKVLFRYNGVLNKEQVKALMKAIDGMH